MKFKWRNIVFILSMILVVILLMDLSQRIDKKERLTAQLETIKVEATSVMETQIGLITQIAYATSDLAVEKWAYEDGKWIKPGEILVELVAAGDTPTPTTSAATIPAREEPRWRLWWNLFFSDQP